MARLASMLLLLGFVLFLLAIMLTHIVWWFCSFYVARALDWLGEHCGDFE